jgi:hypothetical protein
MPDLPLKEFVLRLWAFDCTNTVMTAEIKHKFNTNTLTGKDLRQRAQQFRAIAEELSSQADSLDAANI